MSQGSNRPPLAQIRVKPSNSQMRTLSRMKDVDLILIFYVNTLLMWRHIHTAAVYSLIPAAYCFKHFTGITTENFTGFTKVQI